MPPGQQKTHELTAWRPLEDDTEDLEDLVFLAAPTTFRQEFLVPTSISRPHSQEQVICIHTCTVHVLSEQCRAVRLTQQPPPKTPILCHIVNPVYLSFYFSVLIILMDEQLYGNQPGIGLSDIPRPNMKLRAKC